MVRRIVTTMALAITLSAHAATPRLSYVRVLPPLQQLGGDDIALVYALGDVPTLTSFVETFSDRANKSGDLRVDVAASRQLFGGRRPDQHAMRRLRRQFPVDVYIGIDRLECTTTSRQGEGSSYLPSGERVKRQHHWIDAICRIQLATLDPQTGIPSYAFETKAEGTSPRVEHTGNEERGIAMQQAAHFAAVIAAAAVTPRHIREAIVLDDSAPEFDRAMLLLDAGRLAAARRLFEHAMRTRGETAAVHYNLAAICEAMGDTRMAFQHYQQAIRLAPHEKRYSQELTLFRQRSGIAKKGTPSSDGR